MTWILKLSEWGLELYAPSLGLTVLIGLPHKTGPSLPPAPAIDTTGTPVSAPVVSLADYRRAS